MDACLRNKPVINIEILRLLLQLIYIYIYPSLPDTLNRHLPNENVESKNITHPETHLYGVESGPGPGISFNDSGRLRIQFNLGCLNTSWFYLCIALTPGPGICLNACGNLRIQFFGLICVMFWWHAHMLLLRDMSARSSLLYSIFVFVSITCSHGNVTLARVRRRQPAVAKYRILLSYTNTRNHELEIIRIYISGECNT